MEAPKQVQNVQLVETSPLDDLKLPEGTIIVALAAEYAHQLAIQKEPQAPEEKIEKSEAQKQAEAALDEVKIVIPDGMQVKSHREDKKEENSDEVIKRIQEENDEKKEQ